MTNPNGNVRAAYGGSDPQRGLGPTFHCAAVARISPNLVRLTVAVATFLAMIYYPVALVLSLCALVIWLVPRLYADHRDFLAFQGSERLKDDRFEKLTSNLEVAEAKIAVLKVMLAQAETKPSPQPGHPAFRRVGLDPYCKKIVAEAARRSLRQECHPDRHAPDRKAAMEMKFKEYEASFSEIWRLRGF